MKQLVEEIYQGLKYLGLVENQYEFTSTGLVAARPTYGTISRLTSPPD